MAQSLKLAGVCALTWGVTWFVAVILLFAVMATAGKGTAVLDKTLPLFFAAIVLLIVGSLVVAALAARQFQVGLGPAVGLVLFFAAAQLATGLLTAFSSLVILNR